MDNIIPYVAGAWFFILGTVMGSFYNVLIDRLPNDQDIVKARSECTACHTTLRWYDLIPLLSFFLLRGRCRYCGEKLSWKYPASELGVGGLFLLAYLTQAPLFSAAGVTVLLALWSMLFVVGIMDFQHKIIIDQVLLPFAVVGATTRLCMHTPILDIVQGGAVGLALYGLIYLLARLFYKKEAFGMGDVLLLGAIGVFLGVGETILTGFLAFYCCAAFLLFHFLLKGKMGRKTELAFGPSVCTAAFLVSLFGEGMLEFLKTWFYL